MNNPGGLPSVSGLMLLSGTHTGLVEALFLDDDYHTDARTAAGALAEKYLARADFPEFGQVIAHQATGRAGRDDIGLSDLTRTGIQDTAIASMASQRCLQNQAGTNFVTWKYQDA